MEANKRKCRERALALFYNTSDAKSKINTNKCSCKKENVPHCKESSVNPLKYLTPQKSINKRDGLVWPNVVFSDSKLKSVTNFFEPSEPWYKYETNIKETYHSIPKKSNDRNLCAPGEPVQRIGKKSAAKQCLFSSSSNEWFKHEHDDQDLNERLVKMVGNYS